MTKENYEITWEKSNFLDWEISTASHYLKIIVERLKNKFWIEVVKSKKIYWTKDDITYELKITSWEINEDISREIDRDIWWRPWQKMYFSSKSNRDFVTKTHVLKFEWEKLFITFYF